MATRTPPTLPPLLDDDLVLAQTDPSPPASESKPSTRARRHPGPERRLWSAGHALVVCALALLIGTLLNAPGVHKRAYNQPDGWKRDVALAVTGPLATVSQALFLDRPRAAVQALTGRSGTDEIDTDLGIDEETGAPSAPRKEPRPSAAPAANPADAGAPPPKPVFTPRRTLRMWVAGDSLVITPGYAILRAAASNRAIESVGGVEGRVATGLARPDVFNWFREVRTQLRTLKPDVVVLAFGGNDDKAYMTGLSEGVSISTFGDAAWRKEYRRRVGAVFDAIGRVGAHAVWIGLPQTDDPAQTRRFDVLNSAVAAEARRRPESVTYIDTYLMFSGPDGKYTEYLSLPGGGHVKVRAGDGVHFERAGGDLIAREVLEALNERYDLTTWKKAAKP